MATTGYYAVTSASESDIGGATWYNTSNVYSDDGNYASSIPNGSGTVTNALQGFKNFQSIITDESAIITQIDARIRRLIATAGTVVDNVVKYLVGSIATGTNKASGTGWTTSEVAATYSWTGLSLTWDDIGSGFGLYLIVQNNSGTYRTLYVDQMELNLTYTPSTTYTATASIDAAVQDTPTISCDLDASVIIDSTRYFELDAAVQKQESLSCDMDANVVLRGLVPFSMDAVVGISGGWLNVDLPENDEGWSQVP